MFNNSNPMAKRIPTAMFSQYLHSTIDDYIADYNGCYVCQFCASSDW